MGQLGGALAAASPASRSQESSLLLLAEESEDTPSHPDTGQRVLLVVLQKCPSEGS